MSLAFSIINLRCVDMNISQRLVVETDEGPVEWRRLNQTNLEWLRKRLEREVGQTDDLGRERASNAFLWHLEAILAGGPQEDLFEAFGEGEGDAVAAYWQEWRSRVYGELAGTTPAREATDGDISSAYAGWDRDAVR